MKNVSQALEQFKLLEQSLNNIGFIHSRQSLLFATGVLHQAKRQLGRQSHPVAEGSWNVLHIIDTRGLSSLEGALGGNSFPIVQHNRMKSPVYLSAAQSTWILPKVCQQKLT